MSFSATLLVILLSLGMGGILLQTIKMKRDHLSESIINTSIFFALIISIWSFFDNGFVPTLKYIGITFLTFLICAVLYRLVFGNPRDRALKS